MSFLRRLTGKGNAASESNSDTVRRLETHPALRRLRPLQDRPTFAEWEHLTAEEQSALYEPQIEAIRSLASLEKDEIHDLLGTIGRERIRSGIPVLADIWNTCPASPIRDDAGYALLAIGSPETTTVLWNTRTRWDHTAARLAVRARLVADPPGGVALAEQLLVEADAGDSTSGRLLNELLTLLAPSSFWGDGGQGWTEPDAIDWLTADARWLDLAVRLREHPTFGRAARNVLRYQAREQVERALARQPAQHAPAHREPREVQPWLERYLAGEHESIWDELIALGPIVEPDIKAEAERVAEESMQRVAAAFTELLRRLESFGYPLRLQAEADPGIEDRIRRLAVVAGGPVPISIAGFWRVVGSIDLAPIEDAEWPEWLPTDPLWQERLDPMVVHPLRDVWFDVDDWLADRAGNLSEVVGPLEVSIAPDRLHKVNISGGPPYAIRLPDASADAPIRYLENEPYLIHYLRRAVQGGGFAGVRPDEPMTPAWTEVVAELTRDLPRF